MNEKTKIKLDELGKKLAKADHLVLTVLARRQELAERVALAKWEGGDDILRRSVEEGRIEQAKKLAKDFGLDHNFVAALMYTFISESCRQQLDLLSRVRTDDVRRNFVSGKETWHGFLRSNLLSFASQLAEHANGEFGDDKQAVQQHRAFEYGILERVMTDVSDHALALDLGCGNGSATLSSFTHSCKKVIGLDISPALIQCAQRSASAKKVTRAAFGVHELETDLPLGNGEASIVFMTRGGASEIVNIRKLLSEINRVLKVGGQFILSFYNKDGLAWGDFLPWPPTLGVEFNTASESLDIRWDGKLFTLFTRGYKVADISELFPSTLVPTEVLTHPIVSAVVPANLLENNTLALSIAELDDLLAGAGSELGAFLIVRGRKI